MIGELLAGAAAMPILDRARLIVQLTAKAVGGHLLIEKIEALEGQRGSADSPGVPAHLVPVPVEDLRLCSLALLPPNQVRIGSRDYPAAGRIFKWLQGQIVR